MYTSLEVAITGKHGGPHNVMGTHGIFHLGIQRTGVADAGCTTVAYCLEAEGIQRFLQIVSGEIV